MRHTTETGGVSVSRRGGSAGGSARKERPGLHYSTRSAGVPPERTGWRDEALSLRHRGYGLDCPAVDLDFLLVEFDGGHPRALVEYKCGDPRPLDFDHPSYQAIRHLADAARIPCVVVFYSPVFWHFTCYPLNDFAAEWFSHGECLSELEYVRRLYAIRGREAPFSIERRLNQVCPAEVCSDDS